MVSHGLRSSSSSLEESGLEKDLNQISVGSPVDNRGKRWEEMGRDGKRWEEIGSENRRET